MVLESSPQALRWSARAVRVTQEARRIGWRRCGRVRRPRRRNWWTPTPTRRWWFATELRQVQLSRAKECLVCPIGGCSKELKDATAALTHSAYHILYSPLKVPHIEMCPLCYGPAS